MVVDPAKMNERTIDFDARQDEPFVDKRDWLYLCERQRVEDLEAALLAARHVDAAGRMAERVAGTDLIAAERQRQVTVEGRSSDHDDAHDGGELALAAALLLAEPAAFADPPAPGAFQPPEWAQRLWEKHHGDRVRVLTIAGALVAAEIDRLQRLARDAASGPPP